MLDRVQTNEIADIGDYMTGLGKRARKAASVLATTTMERKHAALVSAAQRLLRSEADILSANEVDVETARDRGLSAAMIDRLTLTSQRIQDIASSLKAIADMKDPVGEVTASWARPNGLKIERVRTPIGVIGVIFEARPNVTADAGALCLMSGNAVILRGGSDSAQSSAAIHACLQGGLQDAGLPVDAIQRVETTDRAAVGEMLAGLSGNMDVIVPRGGRSLVERVQNEARVPVFAHLEGLCHIYVDGSADLEMTKAIAVNAKMRRTGICGAAETLLIDRSAVETHLLPVLAALQDAGCEIRGDETVVNAHPAAVAVTEQDWRTEYLAPIISVRCVDGLDEAIEHIQHYSSGHTEAIISETAENVARFHAEVDSAIVMHNASTQFADGGEFGMGAEIGIATGKMHARGPVGVEQLCSFKYRVHGTGQIRP
ncbi:MAG: glutamate-5-semialdehyde dehydrogenase [Pseudomonadota bacterium]